MELTVTFPEQSEFDRSLILGELYRQALIDVGFSPDMHVYDLDPNFLHYKQDKASGRYLLDVYRFYHSLSDFEGRIFICQVLEYGRHFNFWWLLYGDKWYYARTYSRLISKTNQRFR